MPPSLPTGAPTGSGGMSESLVEVPAPVSPAPHRASGDAWRRWALRIGPPLVYAAAAAYAYSNFLEAPTRRTVGGGDGILFSWYFQWVAHCIAHLQNPFVSAAMNAPTGFNVMWNTAVLALAVVFAPLTFTIGPFATAGLLMTVSPAVSATAAYAVLRRLTGSAAGAFLGGLLYGFGPFLFGQHGHLHLIFAPFPPLLALVGHQLVVRQDKSPVRTGLLLGVLIGVQLLVGEELFAIAAGAAAVALLVYLVVEYRTALSRLRHIAIGLGVGAATAVVIAGVPLGYQLFGPHALKGGFSGGTARADLASLVMPSLLQYGASAHDIHRNLTFPANGAENTAYLGWPLIALVLALCVVFGLRRSRFVYWWLPTTLIVVALSLGSPVQVDGHRLGHGLWAVARRIPLYGGILPVRFSLMTALLIGVLLAWCLAKLRSGWLVGGVLVVAAAMAPLWPAHRVAAEPLPATPAFFTTSAVRQIPAGSTVLVLPMANFPHVEAMVWQARADMRFNMIGGYSVFSLDGRTSYFTRLPQFVRLLNRASQYGIQPSPPEVLAGKPSLQASHVRFIVITKYQPGAAAVAEAASRITGCHPQAVSDVTLCAVPAA